jgi:hypothetical protein
MSFIKESFLALGLVTASISPHIDRSYQMEDQDTNPITSLYEEVCKISAEKANDPNDTPEREGAMNDFREVIIHEIRLAADLGQRDFTFYNFDANLAISQSPLGNAYTTHLDYYMTPDMVDELVAEFEDDFTVEQSWSPIPGSDDVIAINFSW